MGPRILACALLAGVALAQTTYKISTVAGGVDAGDGLAAAAAQLSSPEGLAIDSAGNVYISDSADHRVRKVSPDGIISTVAGDGYPGSGAGRLNFPYGLAVDGAGALYIADLGNARVLKIAADGSMTIVAAGAPLVQPRNLAADQDGGLYISDFGGHTVYKVDPAGRLRRVAGTGAAGSIGDAAVVDALAAPLNAPAGLATGPDGALYVADSGNHRIRKIMDGRMSTVRTGNVLGTPTGIALDAEGRLYTADKGSGVVLCITQNSTMAVAPPGIFNAPRDVALDAAGNLYVADSRAAGRYWAGTVRRMAPGGAPAAFAGDGTYRAPGDGGPALRAHLEGPAGLALDAAGNLYIADRYNHRVRKLSSGVVTTVAGTGAAASDPSRGLALYMPVHEPAAVAGDGAGGLRIAEAGTGRLLELTREGVMGPVAEACAGDGGIAVDGAGNTYIADTAHDAIRKASAGGAVEKLAAFSGLILPGGVALDGQGSLYVADTGNRAVRVMTRAGFVSTVRGGTGLPSPSRIALDRAGNLYIAAAADHRVWKLTPEGEITAIAGTGAAGYSGDGGPALSAELNEPADVAVNDAGEVFIADRADNRIRKLTPWTPEESAPAQVTSVVNAASMLPGPVAPGELVVLSGTGLGPREALPARLAASGLIDTTLGDVEVLFDGTPAPLISVEFGRVELQVPYSVAARRSSEVEIRREGVTAARLLVPVAEAAPAIFTGPDGIAAEAVAGGIATIYATGEGLTDPAGTEGKLAEAPYPAPVLAPAVFVAGSKAKILFAASAPGFAGLMQINFRIPENCPAGNQLVELAIGEARSPAARILVR
jgi:uncharacterized protein (TIGR03437 family)